MDCSQRYFLPVQLGYLGLVCETETLFWLVVHGTFLHGYETFLHGYETFIDARQQVQ